MARNGIKVCQKVEQVIGAPISDVSRQAVPSLIGSYHSEAPSHKIYRDRLPSRTLVQHSVETENQRPVLRSPFAQAEPEAVDLKITLPHRRVVSPGQGNGWCGSRFGFRRQRVPQLSGHLLGEPSEP